SKSSIRCTTRRCRRPLPLLLQVETFSPPAFGIDFQRERGARLVKQDHLRITIHSAPLCGAHGLSHLVNAREYSRSVRLRTERVRGLATGADDYRRHRLS